MKYVFDHFLLNGEVHGGPQISIKMMVETQLIAVYVEEIVPPPPSNLGPIILSLIAIGAITSKKKD